MRTADVVFTTTGPIAERVRQAAPHTPVHQVGHALHGPWLKDLDVCRAPKGHAPRSVAFAGGLTTHYVDWWALRTIAEAHPDLHFDLYGPYDRAFPDADFTAFHALPNVRFHGVLHKGELVPALRAADVLLLCYRADLLLEQLAYPHKMLEYLSTGNPLVCSRTLAFEAYPALVEMAATREGIVDVFRRTIADHARLDTRDARAARIAFAGERTTEHLIARIEPLIP
jgi:glycosyltransferase involved in cell wall biosynthesis